MFQLKVSVRLASVCGMLKILIVEDDVAIRTGVSAALADRGHTVMATSSAMEGLRQALVCCPDLVLLDLGLPDLNGREVLRMLRAISQVPIIVITAHSAESEIVRALDAGADDYVVKPFGAAEIDARIRAVLRRAETDTRSDMIVAGGLRIDLRRRRAWLDGQLLDLTPREFDLLVHLAAHQGDVVAKRTLMVEVWQAPYTNTDKTVDVHLSWLRRKLGETAQQPRYLHTVRGQGICLRPPAELGSGASDLERDQ
jgi:two-component system, OmpR family, KDP operon response regulator KdpE